jgi:hypothetical protein
MKVASESEELASSTALATFCSNTSALDEALRTDELVLEYEYKRGVERSGGLRISRLGGDSVSMDRRSSYERHDTGLPSEDTAAERDQFSGLLGR